MGQVRLQEVIKNVMWLSISARVCGPKHQPTSGYPPPTRTALAPTRRNISVPL